MYTIKNNVSNEIIINKSRFITYLYKVKNIDEVNNYLDELKKEYKDATHICFSYIINNTKRFSDDNEPSGTAGIPILNILENNNLNYVLCCVVRYFGGIKLGAGGLLRAYSNSAKECLDKVDLNEILIGKKVTITFNYDNSKYIDNLLKDINIIDKKFDSTITYTFEIDESKYNIIDNLKDYIIEIIDNIEIEKEA